MTPPVEAPAPRRTSPLIVLVHTATFRQARQFVPLVIPVVAATGFGGGTTTVVLLAVAVTLLSLGTALLSWTRFGYVDGPTSVVVTKGLLARSVRTVPNDRVRGVEVETPVLHRLLGLVKVRIDAAAGSLTGDGEELVVDGVTRAEGDRLRASVLAHRIAASRAEGAEPLALPAEEEIARFDPRWLRYAPLVGSYLAVPLAAVGALFRLLDELPRPFRPEFDGPDVVTARLVVSTVVVALLLLVVGSVIGAAVVNWRFRLLRRGGSLVAVRGLLTRRHTELEIDRIRGGTLTEGLGMRLAGAARTTALVTGLGQATRRGQLLPLGPRAEAERLLHRLVEDAGPLQRHPPAARRRRLVRALLGGAAVTVAGLWLAAIGATWAVLVIGLVLTVLGVPLGLGRYAALGHATGPRSFSVRAGFLVREQAVLQRRAVVGWQVQQTFFQRRAGLATVTACVGAGSGGYQALDMDAGEVERFTEAASGTWARAFGMCRPG